MTAIIRLYGLNSKQQPAQFGKEELGKCYVCSFKDKQKRMNCVIDREPGGFR